MPAPALAPAVLPSFPWWAFVEHHSLVFPLAIHPVLFLSFDVFSVCACPFFRWLTCLLDFFLTEFILLTGLFLLLFFSTDWSFFTEFIFVRHDWQDRRVKDEADAPPRFEKYQSESQPCTVLPCGYRPTQRLRCSHSHVLSTTLRSLPKSTGIIVSWCSAVLCSMPYRGQNLVAANQRHQTAYISAPLIRVGPPGFFTHISITTPIVSAFKNYYI
jgi:hypothetical protein